MKVIPKLNLNQNPQNCEEGSLVFAKNMRVDYDGSLTSDYGYANISAATSLSIVGHIIGLDNKIYLFTRDNCIYEYDEETKSLELINAAWTYNGGEIDGYVSTNISGEKILTIAEYVERDEIKIPLKHINLSFCDSEDDESLYTQAPKVPICNLTLNTTYAKTIPNGTYVFFIRYKIRRDCYTDWYLCSRPIFGGTSTKITTLQGGVSHIDHHTDAAKSFVFDVTFLNTTAKSSYSAFQLGFIISHDDSTNARIWKEFSIDSNKIYFDYEDIKEANIDEMLATTYDIYNVRNITSFKNKLYIGNYKESEINVDESIIANKIHIKENHTHDTGSDEPYGIVSLNNILLAYNKDKGYFDKTASGSSIKPLLSSPNFNYQYSNLYKGDAKEQGNICNFVSEWKDSGSNLDETCLIYKINNNAYDNAVFGKSAYNQEYDLSKEREELGLHLIHNSNKRSYYSLPTLSSKYHTWHNLGLSYAYGSIMKDSPQYPGRIDNVFPFNTNTRTVEYNGTKCWVSEDASFSKDDFSVIENNINSELKTKNRFVACYAEITYGANVYKIGYETYMDGDNYIGLTNDNDFGFDNAKVDYMTVELQRHMKSIIETKVLTYADGVDEEGHLVLLINKNNEQIAIRASHITFIFKAIEFTPDKTINIDDDSHYKASWKIDAKITEWRSECNFDFKAGCVTIDDNTNNIIQKQTLMPLSTYNIYAHFVDENHIITNGMLVDTINTTAAKSNVDTLQLAYKVDSLSDNITDKYKAFFLSVVNTGNNVAECFGYKRIGTTSIVNVIEIDTLLYNINTNITIQTIINGKVEVVTDKAKYYSSASSNPSLAFGNCGYLTWTDNNDYTGKPLYVVIERNTSTEENPILTKATPYIPLEENTDYNIIVDGFYGAYFCLIKKPSFDLSSSCYVSGNDVYAATREAAITLKDFNGYIQIQNSVTYYIRSNFNLNYLSLTEDIDDQIFSIGSASSGLKQVAKVINSATLSYIYELKGMYKDFRNKTFKVYNPDVNKVDFDNTVRVSNVLSDETYNNSVFKFKALDYYNVPTDRGIIVKLFTISNNIFVHTKGSLYKFDANQTIVSNENDISLTESEPFEHGIFQVCDSQYGYAGINDKHSGCITFDSYVFYDKQNNHIFAYGGRSQLSIIDETIYKILDHYKPENCRIIHDEKNNRVLINFVINTYDEITLSYNYKLKSFISLHDLTLRNAFNSKNKCYSYNTILLSLFDESRTIQTYIYGGATKNSYLTDSHYYDTYKDYKYSLSVIMFPTGEHQRANVDSVQYIADYVKNNFVYDASRKVEILDIAMNTKINPVKEFFITTDECKSTSVVTTIDDEARPNTLLDYKGFKYNLGFWVCNYFRNNLNTENVYSYPDQPGVDIPIPIEEGRTSYKTRVPNTDNYSLVYGKYFILTFGFDNNRPIKFENVLINNSLY